MIYNRQILIEKKFYGTKLYSHLIDGYNFVAYNGFPLKKILRHNKEFKNCWLIIFIEPSLDGTLELDFNSFKNNMISVYCDYLMSDGDKINLVIKKIETIANKIKTNSVFSPFDSKFKIEIISSFDGVNI